jgi:hypothetical protein
MSGALRSVATPGVARSCGQTSGNRATTPSVDGKVAARLIAVRLSH